MRTGIGFSFQDLTEEARNSITMRALEQGIRCWDKDIRRYVNSVDYLEINQNINEFSLLILIITLKRETHLNPKCLVTYIKDEKIDDKSIKELIKYNQYKNFSITPEPININSNRIVKIQFKYPDGIQTLERNFLKEDLIDSLYKFIKYTNIGYDFYLIQRFPYKIYNVMTNTLEQENLYPSAVVQIIKK